MNLRKLNFITQSHGNPLNLYLLKNRRILASICPKKKKTEGFMFTSYQHSGKLDTFIANKEFINNKKYQDVDVINANFEYASAYIDIIEIDVPQAKIEKYIAKRLEQYKNNENIDLEVQKIASDFYIIKMKSSRKNVIVKKPYQERMYKIYLRCTPTKSYEVIYSTNAYFYNDFMEDANLVLRSFTIK